MSWDINDRPKKPQSGKPVRSTVATKARASGGRRSGETGVRFCAPSAGAKTRCDSFPKAKAAPATPPEDTSYTSSAFTMKKGRTGAYNDVCVPGKKDPWDNSRCNVQVGYRAGRRVLRFCVGERAQGHVIDVHGKGPDEVRSVAQKACAAWRKSGSYTGTTVGKAALGGVRRTKAAKRRKISKRGRR